ncbi:hypothetical protein Sta7437_0172 [Stanieria cyanosphaera PCC 7437]|uniref:Uncharacterized protein n=1 Tax=Stanieria cyanosphaera (strain ATCC 29371 / PCC 7437) TaxID=111780 RepID=K9XMG2_STAC7|nr:DUF6464 family protein [Stanieria cyanosphaera]AFZ33790.1 hypothetical protein Sta7437_0172 [Stanieria cyanosphaera PCC 7437]
MTHSLVIKLALILLLSILPSLISIFILHRVKQRWQSKLLRLLTAERSLQGSEFDSEHSPLPASTSSRLRRVRLMTDYTSSVSSSGNELLGHFYEYELDSFGNQYSTEFKKYFVGDVSCRYNAYSPYIRCAVNPDGPCQDCIHYQAK